MHALTDNQLFDFELAYKHNPDVRQLIGEIRELRLQLVDATVEQMCVVCWGDEE